MLSKTIWLAGLALESAILAQCLRTRLFKRFPIFYIYLFCVFASSTGMWFLQDREWTYYRLFWTSEYLMIFLGYGVVLEIMHHALIYYPGAEGFARISGFLVFAVLFSALGASWLMAKNPFALYPWQNYVEVLERDFRVVQAIFLALTAIVVMHYRILLGRNVQGLLLGMGIYVSVSVMSPELRFYFGDKFQAVYGELQSVVYLLSVGIWTVALWSPAEVPVPPRNPPMEIDYERLVQKIQDALNSARSNLNKAVGQ